MNKFKKFKRFEDYLTSDTDNKIQSFGEYRKGSNEYGPFIQEIMMFLRNFKKGSEDKLVFPTKNITFDLNTLNKLKNDENKSRLVSFHIKFTDKNGNIVNNINKDGNVIFSDLNKKEDRPWENKNLNEERI